MDYYFLVTNDYISTLLIELTLSNLISLYIQICYHTLLLLTQHMYNSVKDIIISFYTIEVNAYPMKASFIRAESFY